MEVQDYAITSAQYWTRKSNQILNLYVAKNLQKVLNNTNHLKNNAYDDSEANGG